MRIVNHISELPNSKIWYHGTTQIELISIKSGINFDVCNPQVDFGRGFYLTANYDQAWRWGKKKALIHNESRDNYIEEFPDQKPPDRAYPAVIMYEVDTMALGKLNEKVFTKVDEDWARFILGNRSLHGSTHSPVDNRNAIFDCVYGPLADGNRLSYLVEKAERTGNIQEFLEKIKGIYSEFPTEHQLSIHTEAAKASLTRKGEKINEPSSKSFRR